MIRAYIGPCLFAAALACTPKSPGDTDSSSSSDSSSSPSTSESSSSESSTSESSGPTTGSPTTGGTTETTGDVELMCEIEINQFYIHDEMYAVLPVGEVDEPCAFVSAAEVGPALELSFDCPDFAAEFSGPFVVRIESGPRPSPLPEPGAMFDVFASGFDDDPNLTSHAWLSLRRDGELVYAVTEGEQLLTEVLGDPAAYSPLDISRADVCEFVEAGETGVVDGSLLCLNAALSRLSIRVDDLEEVALADGEATTVAAAGVPYAIEVAQVRRLKDCNVDPQMTEFPRYDFVIAAQSE